MNVLVTGASSYVGARLYQDLVESGEHDVTGTYFSKQLFQELEQLDVRDKEKTVDLIRRVGPDVIVHTVANPNSKWCEANSSDAIKLNVAGTRYVVTGAKEVGAKVIYISSFSAIKPTNRYGNTKRIAEGLLRSPGLEYVVLRPSLIIGQSPNTTNDRPHNRFLRDIEQGESREYDNSYRFQLTWLKHLSEVVQRVISKGTRKHTIPVAVPGKYTRYEIARDILKFFNIDAKASEERDLTPSLSVDLKILEQLGIPRYYYIEVITGVVREIKKHLEE
jgi:dTDP-4-dehydrorhamnose reductase